MSSAGRYRNIRGGDSGRVFYTVFAFNGWGFRGNNNYHVNKRASGKFDADILGVEVLIVTATNRY
jgi:hypothetical protein